MERKQITVRYGVTTDGVAEIRIEGDEDDLYGCRFDPGSTDRDHKDGLYAACIFVVDVLDASPKVEGWDGELFDVAGLEAQILRWRERHPEKWAALLAKGAA